MKTCLKSTVIILTIGCFISLLSGCTVVFQTGRTSDLEKLKMTKDELAQLKQAYAELQESLSKEIAEKQVSLGMEERGLVITFVDSVLFDSGKAELRPESFQTLDKVVAVCQGVVADRPIGIEGHTDNEPIKYSGWKSNWELSTARATSVLSYLTKQGISGERLSATGFGEYRPVTTNSTVEGRQKNRRVEIVIVPEKIAKVKPAPAQPLPKKQILEEETPQEKYIK